MKRLLMIGVIPVLLLVLAQGNILAAKPAAFSATGTISGISPGDVAAAGESGRWRITERELTGELSGDVGGTFVMSYKGNVELVTQAGDFHGTLATASMTFGVNGKIQPLEMAPIGNGVYLPKLTFSGHWAGTEGICGNGEFSGWLIFVPSQDGHVATIVASSFDMSGQR